MIFYGVLMPYAFTQMAIDTDTDLLSFKGFDTATPWCVILLINCLTFGYINMHIYVCSSLHYIRSRAIFIASVLMSSLTIVGQCWNVFKVNSPQWVYY